MSEQSTKPAYTKPLPDMRPEGDHWWKAMHEHTFLLPTDADGKPFWYPRALVPGTSARGYQKGLPVESVGRSSLCSFIAAHQWSPSGRMSGRGLV